MKFWLLRPKGFSYHYTDTESCWGCVVRAPDRETATGRRPSSCLIIKAVAASTQKLGDPLNVGYQWRPIMRGCDGAAGTGTATKTEADLGSSQ